MFAWNGMFGMSECFIHKKNVSETFKKTRCFEQSEITFSYINRNVCKTVLEHILVV